MVEKRREERGRGWGGVNGGGLPCSGSWFCGGVMPNGVGDEEGEVE